MGILSCLNHRLGIPHHGATAAATGLSKPAQENQLLEGMTPNDHKWKRDVIRPNRAEWGQVQPYLVLDPVLGESLTALAVEVVP